MPKPFRSNSVSEWLKYLEQMHPKIIDMGLDRMRPVAEKICPVSPCKVVTVAGTNGKGTTVAALQTLLTQQGMRVGVYTSPHLFHFNERIVLDLGEGARPATDQELLAAFNAIEAARGDVTLTYFEATTLAALYIFRHISPALDVIILEVGLGGRLDSTNVVDADIAVITRIAFDHMDYLGDTREKIAREKAGIMRASKPCIYGGNDLQSLMQQMADEHGAHLYCYERDFQADAEMERVSNETLVPVENLACAQKAFTLLGGEVKPGMWAHLALKKPKGRFTKVTWEGKTVIFDVAHNPDAMTLLAKNIKSLPYSDIRIVIGMLSDKDHAASVSPLKQDQRVHFYVSSPSGTPRAAPTDMLMAALNGSDAQAFDTLSDAFKASLESSSENTVWVVAGSFFTVAEIWENLRINF